MTGTDFGIPQYGHLREIGRGGFAVVYRGRDARFNRDVAVKVLTGTLDSDSEERFLQECAAVGSLSGHPNIVSVHDAGSTEDGRTFLVMEYLPGNNLAERSRDGMPWGEAATIAAALAGALESAHEAGILHRDVKPENVLFTSFGAAKLVDFGIARVGSGRETTSAAITASLAHAAPEVIAGQRATALSDVYSLGSTLFQALAGRAAYVAGGEETLVPLIARVSTAPVPDLRPLGVPSGIAEVVEKSMSKNPTDRPSSAAAFADELRAAAAASGHRLPEPVIVPVVTSVEDSIPLAASTTAVVGRRPAAVVHETEPLSATPSRRRRAGFLVAGGALLLAVLGAAGFALASSGGAEQQAAGQDVPVAPAAGASPQSTSESPTGDASPAPASEPTESSAPTLGSSGSGEDRPAPRSSTPTAGTNGAASSPANAAPTLAALGGRVTDELQNVDITFSASDADGDALRFMARGLPQGLAMSTSGRITGTIAATAANATTDRRIGVESQGFDVMVDVSDGTTSSSAHFIWTVRDTHRTMPDYLGKFGCNGDTGCSESVPNVAAISSPSFTPCEAPAGRTHSTILRQSVATEATIRWGQSIVYTYVC